MSRRPAQAALGLLALLASAAPAHALSASALRSRLAGQSRVLGSASGAYVRDLDTGKTLYSRRPDVALAPASNEKLLVTATALLRLGPTATLPTEVVSAAAPVDGVIDGDVALVGGGDPFLRRADLATLAQRVADTGVTKITGRVLADASLLDSRVGSFDSGWRYDSDLGGRMGALVVDGGRGTDPALYAAQAFRDALRRVHVTVGAHPRRGRLGSGAVTLAGIDSAPLSTLIAEINVPSDNFGAELLLKDIGARAGGAGTTFAGAAVVRSTLANLGVRATIYDGSGLSRADQVSPRMLERLLERMATRPEGAAFAASLPVAGRTGTLASRMRRTAARGRCRAKTGTLIGVSALSGYCTSTTGARIAFSFVENRVCAVCAKRIEDRMVAALAGYDPGTPPPAQPAPSSGSSSGGASPSGGVPSSS